MKEFFHSWVFKVLLALCIVMFAFRLRATMTMGASTVVEQMVGTITAPVSYTHLDVYKRQALAPKMKVVGWMSACRLDWISLYSDRMCSAFRC